MQEIRKSEANKIITKGRITSIIFGAGLITCAKAMWSDWGEGFWGRIFGEEQTILPIIIATIGTLCFFKGSPKRPIKKGIIGLAPIVYATALLNGRGVDMWENPVYPEIICFTLGGIILARSIIDAFCSSTTEKS